MKTGRIAFVFPGVVALCGTLVFAQQKPGIKMVPVERTSVVDARGMFISYCAACHGPEGKGNGPAAVALKQAPADLTRISARNGGKFPDTTVYRFIMGLDQVAAHGSRDMPIWGNVFRSLDPTSRTAAEQRGRNLTEYVKSLQP
jgi:mono/diheme cytochrome c family protein